jgi:hypothetical protein
VAGLRTLASCLDGVRSVFGRRAKCSRVAISPALYDQSLRGSDPRGSLVELGSALAVVVLSGVELNFAEHRPGEVAEDLDLVGRPVSGFVVDCAQGAEHLSVGAD